MKDPPYQTQGNLLREQPSKIPEMGPATILARPLLRPAASIVPVNKGKHRQLVVGRVTFRLRSHHQRSVPYRVGINGQRSRGGMSDGVCAP
jgi:hypothetical protein